MQYTGSGGPNPASDPGVGVGDASVGGKEGGEAAETPELLVDVVDRLADLRRRIPDQEIDLCLVDLRVEAARRAGAPSPDAESPDIPDDPFPGQSEGLPEVHSSDLTPEVLTGAVAHHGALLVREMFDTAQAVEVIAAIERIRKARSSNPGGPARGDQDGWYRPLPTATPLKSAIERGMVARQGGTWMADSPTTTSMVLDTLRESGVIDAIAGHLGERPHFSLQKSTLRRSLPEPDIVGWHQDGSFLGPDVRTMNVWVALTPCGGDLPTPGLEVVPRRLEELLPLGSDLTAHSIPFEVVNEITEQVPSIVPEFAQGDGLLFDHKFLHRTHLPSYMTDIRYALECWFFAPSHHATEYVPLLA